MMQPVPDGLLRTFSANRAYGQLHLSVIARDGGTRIERLREEGSLRVRFPAHAAPLEAVMLNNAGGIAGGDRFATSVEVGAEARLTVTTAAAEKVYRSHGPAAMVDVRIDLEAGAQLDWLPHEMILFESARLDRTISINIAARARLLFAEALILGRSAMGEAVRTGALIDRRRVRREGRLIFADGICLDGEVADTMARVASSAGAVALATVLMVPGDDEMLAAIRARELEFRGEVGVSSWNGLATARLVARDGAALRHDLGVVLAATAVTLPRLWVN